MTKHDDELAQDLKAAWHRFVDALAPLRPDLYAYCRQLTGNVWDAEDLVQDTLTRAFGRWGVTYPPIANPKAYLLRTASNLWIDRVRRPNQVAVLQPDGPASEPIDTQVSVRDAGRRLLHRLSPQEQAALVLKETFGLTIAEIADVLATTPGAVKAALHRGRERLNKPASEVSHRPPPPRALVEQFVVLFDAKDLDGLVALFAEGATAENLGNSYHIGSDPEWGFRRVLKACVHGHPEWPDEFQRDAVRLEIVEQEGEPVILSIVTRNAREYLGSIFRLDVADGKITRFRSYGFCPETVREVAEHAGLRAPRGVYRAPTPAPGHDWRE